MQEESRQETPGFILKKKVDESWKNAVEKERSAAFSQSPPAAQIPVEDAPKTDPALIYFISGLGMQTLAALGEMPDESGLTSPPDLAQAKQLIDVLELLARKTKGNLSPEEETAFRELLRELRLKFVQKSRA